MLECVRNVKIFVQSIYSGFKVIEARIFITETSDYFSEIMIVTETFDLLIETCMLFIETFHNHRNARSISACDTDLVHNLTYMCQIC